MNRNLSFSTGSKGYKKRNRDRVSLRLIILVISLTFMIRRFCFPEFRSFTFCFRQQCHSIRILQTRGDEIEIVVSVT
eukprot:g82399.t1